MKVICVQKALRTPATGSERVARSQAVSAKAANRGRPIKLPSQYKSGLLTLIKKENQIFLIQSGAVAKSYMRKGSLEEMRKYFPYMTLQLLHSEFPDI